MTLAPVVERELRVAARERNTYRLRLLAAALTAAFSGFSLWIVTLFGAVPIPGRDLFLALSWIEFVFIAVAGFSLTCDCISEEKRDGTLGLLFLTDLNGWDVALGKLTVAALRGLCALVGTLPVLALPILMGGTNGSEFARVCATLVVTLFLSMGVGIAISSFVKRSWTAFGLSAGMMFILMLVLPACSFLAQRLYQNSALADLLALPSPSRTLVLSFRGGATAAGFSHVRSLGILAALAAAGMATACLAAPFAWKDRPPRRALGCLIEIARALKYGRDLVQKQFRARLFRINPVYWLCRRERISSPGLMLMLLTAGSAAFLFSNRDWSSRMGWQANAIMPFMAWMFCAGTAHGLILLRIPVVAAERFGEDRKNGALELLLSTPLSITHILRGHWMALARYFTGPALITLLIHVLVLGYFSALQPMIGDRNATLGTLAREIFEHLVGISAIPPGRMDIYLAFLVMTGLIPALVLDWIALAWVGTWLGLRARRALTGPISTLLLVHVPPLLLFVSVMAMIEEAGWRAQNQVNQMLFYYALALSLMLGHQTACIGWARRQLSRHFRAAAADRCQAAFGWWRFRIV